MASTLAKYYNQKEKRTISIPISIALEPKPGIVKIMIGDNLTTLKMAPKWFIHDDENESLKNIQYPEGIDEKQQQTFNTLARYRKAIEKPNNNFRKIEFKPEKSNTEVVVLALDNFVQKWGGEMSFTNQELPFHEPTYRTACGIADVSSAHLLATDYITTAHFKFLVDLDYSRNLARSNESMQDFILNFTFAISEVINCSKDYVRINSVRKSDKKRRHTVVCFGVTTPDAAETEDFAERLKAQARDGFGNHRILKHVNKDDYECKWKPVISFFQLKPDDFDQQFNIDYAPNMTAVDMRGGCPYYLPRGWFRHALKVVDKFPHDNLWLGSNNSKGEWPVAFHGTRGSSVKGIREQGFMNPKRDAMLADAVRQGGDKYNRSGFYVATHCTGGAHPAYTTPFSVNTGPDKNEEFLVVFQCRVKPGEFTVHQSVVEKGHAWRFVDPKAIRPYGLLLKNKSTPDVEVDDVD